MKKIYVLFLSLIFVQIFSQNNEEAERKSMMKSEQGRYMKMIDFNENPNTLNYDLQYQRLELTLDPAIQYVSGTVTSKFQAKQNMSSIYFDLSNVLTVSEVKYHGVNLPFTQLATKELKIDFPATIPAATIDSLSVKYSGAPETVGSAGDAFAHSRTDQRSGRRNGGAAVRNVGCGSQRIRQHAPCAIYDPFVHGTTGDPFFKAER